MQNGQDTFRKIHVYTYKHMYLTINTKTGHKFKRERRWGVWEVSEEGKGRRK